MVKNVGLIFIGEKNLEQGWPYKGFDTVGEARILRDIIVSLSEKNNISLNYKTFGVLSSLDELNKVKDEIHKMDGLIITYLTTGGVYDVFREIAYFNKPSIIYAQPFSGHEWSIFSKLKKNTRTVMVASSNIMDLIDKIKLLEAVLSLKNLRILLIKDTKVSNEYLSKMREKYGVDIVCLDHNVLSKYYDDTDTKEAERLADTVISKSVKVVEPSREEIVKAARIYFALKHMLEDYNAKALTMDCLSMIYHRAIPTTPCLAFSLLNDEGIPAACEADLNSLITMIILKHITGKPSFISDPVPDYSKGCLYHAHCTSATRLKGIGREQGKYYLRNHAESLSGVAVQTLWPVGEIVTSAKIETEENIMLLHTGKIVDNVYIDRGCRTKFAVKVANVKKFVEEFRGRLHRIIVLGDYMEQLRDIATLLGLEVIEEI
ncbi:MAG: hypothetical protein B6U94_02170 [Thermofilum sp. ex4484_79]|nr:MAG: hypothetical protein B6U94_02170 [Thermofilum sp. ex4484_79]